VPASPVEHVNLGEARQRRSNNELARARGSGNAAHVRLAIRCGYVARQGTTRGIVGSMHARSFGLLSGRGDSRSRGGGRRRDRHRVRGMLGAVFEPGESQNRSGDSKLELFQFQSRRS